MESPNKSHAKKLNRSTAKLLEDREHCCEQFPFSGFSFYSLEGVLLNTGRRLISEFNIEGSECKDLGD